MCHLRELSIFIDESGDFGEYDKHTPYYIIAMVFHDQGVSISDAIVKLDQELSYMNIGNMCIHTGPIIRREGPYGLMSITERRRVFNKLVAFFRQIDICYKCISIEKKHADDVIQMTALLSQKLAQFIRANYDYLLSFESVKVYYDNGQIELSRIIASVFSALISHIKFRKVMPKDYKLFQIADLVCSMELLNHKISRGALSNSEYQFFGSQYDLKRNYLRHIQKKEWK